MKKRLGRTVDAPGVINGPVERSVAAACTVTGSDSRAPAANGRRTILLNRFLVFMNHSFT
jgi:hypothetical protein